MNIDFVFRRKSALLLVGMSTGLLYVINFSSGQLLSILFAIPGLSGIVTGFTVPFFLVLTFLITRGIGTFTLMWTIYSAAAIPTLLMGPPGPYKIIIGIVAGLTFDLCVFLGRGRAQSLYFGFLVYTATMMALFLTLLKYFNLPGFDITVKAVAIITIVFVTEGLFSVFLATKAYKRFKKYSDDFSVIGE